MCNSEEDVTSWGLTEYRCNRLKLSIWGTLYSRSKGHVDRNGRWLNDLCGKEREMHQMNWLENQNKKLQYYSKQQQKQTQKTNVIQNLDHWDLPLHNRTFPIQVYCVQHLHTHTDKHTYINVCIVIVLLFMNIFHVVAQFQGVFAVCECACAHLL